jgi:hypothetical protein
MTNGQRERKPFDIHDPTGVENPGGGSAKPGIRDEEKHEWNRQLRETSRSYELFCVYRNLGPERSLAKAKESAKGIPSVARLKVLSRKWNWVQRARAYDDCLERQRRQQQEKDRRIMHERHAKIALLGQNIAVKGLENLLGKVQNGEQVAPGDLSRLLDTSVKVERLARGESTENHEVSGPGGGPIEISDALSKLLDKLAR